MNLQQFAQVQSALFDLKDEVNTTEVCHNACLDAVASAFDKLSEEDKHLVRSFCNAELADIIFGD